MAAFRWLLVGLHQDMGHLLDLFRVWREWRLMNKPPLPDGAAPYYANVRSQRDFLEFVESHYLPLQAKARTAIRTLLDYEKAFFQDLDEPQKDRNDDGVAQPRPAFAAIGKDDKPALANGIKVTALQADYRKIVQCLRRQGRLDRVPCCVHCVGSDSYQLSPAEPTWSNSAIFRPNC